MEHILIVDDDISLLRMLKMRLEAENYQITDVTTGSEAQAAVTAVFFDLAIIDYQLSDETGIELMGLLNKIDPELPVIILTAYGTIEKAVLAIKKGAYSYLTKPFDDSELIQQVKQCLEKNKLTKEIKALRGMVSEKFGFENIIAKDEKMKAVLRTSAQAAETDSSILIEGESGTGKELIAKSIHVSSPRRNGPFIAINCAAIPESLFESELFGYKKGAFTGAAKNKKGFLEQAQNGTFFFDEISEIPISIQAKLLRVLQENEFYPLGGSEKIKFEARIISATNKKLAEEVSKGNFRQDLYYRIHVIPITLPPLRERRDCIPILAHCFLNDFSQQMGKNVSQFSPGAMKKLMTALWPGNVRELKNIVEYCVAMSSESVISQDMILLEPDKTSNELKPFKQAKLEFEKKYIIQLLELTKGNVSRAAKLAGKYRADFYDLMNKCGLKAEDFRDAL
ncbi:sigma-54 dependent two component DNA-binding response regulator (Fis family protein) [Desulforapulum autotrophicum HRM2]|uniref:Sigma-54 dependent two component DNA-binding response regulator (Fis family protein) n=1 Tax=Desulforapulum autotrophicum (strain ATCC 43914 / DSM 3382 / VKM B-1955 / HRM2) TaxID=177437 RepID=C0QCS7_DESAH|nr:sigma-54 dependent transcriptional regulator [Desulforapulum autotrophicum]ACN15154.1 sigma-54 dependent two component DNA-binding response regulator (Fis family protein) [Desulforapulum autotrophicum HRM2]